MTNGNPSSRQSGPRQADELLTEFAPNGGSPRSALSMPSEAPNERRERRNDPASETRLRVLDAIMREVWPRLWGGLEVEIDGIDQIDPLSVWRANVIGLSDAEFAYGIDMAKQSAREFPPNPGQFREWCKAAPPPPTLALTHQRRPWTDAERQRAAEHVERMREMLR